MDGDVYVGEIRIGSRVYSFADGTAQGWQLGNGTQPRVVSSSPGGGAALRFSVPAGGNLQLWIQAVSHQMTIVEFPVPLVYLDEKRSFGGSLDDSEKRLAYYRDVLKREMKQQHLGCGGR